MNEVMFEFAMTIKNLINFGWQFVEIQYVEKKFGESKLIIQKNQQILKIDNYTELNHLLEKEYATINR